MAIERFIIIFLLINVTFANNDPLETQLQTVEARLALSMERMISELKDAQIRLHSVQSELDVTKSTLKDVNLRLKVSEEQLNYNNIRLEKTEADLKITRAELSVAKLECFKADLTREDIRKEVERDIRNDYSKVEFGRQTTGHINEELAKGQRQVIRRRALDGLTSDLSKQKKQQLKRGRRVSDGFNEKAFSAQMTDHAQSLVSHQTILFPHVVLNEGSAFDNQTGVFTCPEAGVYHFDVTIMAFSNEQVETELVINGNLFMRNFAGGYQRYNQGTNSVLARLSVGDRVWVRIMKSPSINTDGVTRVYGYAWSTFSGYMI